ncbi:MAG: hypothetical protein O9340_02590 [Cyclobacteriaceae bacterium]|nr:hypothetical protein [Cyclobacteriaceae bacterium]
MKFFLFALVVFLTLACDGQNLKSKNLKSSKFQTDSVTGIWISEVYLDEITKSKSIFEKRNLEPGMLGFEIKRSDLESKDLTLYGFTSHEGGIDIAINFNTKNNKFTFDNTASIKLFNEPVEVNFINKQKLNLFFLNSKNLITYRKVTDLQTELRKILFEGEFESVIDKRKFSFNRKGFLKGFSNKLTFEVLYDFSSNLEFDAIIMYKDIDSNNISKGDVYTYKFDSDTLRLYYVKTNWETLEHRVEGLKFELVKTK